MPQQSPLFRQAALDRLSSPEQLDQLMQVVTSRGWMALLALACIVVTACAWAVFGSIPTTVMGQGILIKAGGIHDIDVLGSGVLSELYVREGDVVEKGQVVAQVAQPQLQQQVLQARNELAMLKTRRANEVQYSATNITLETASFDGQKEKLLHQIDALKARIQWLIEQEEAKQKALQLGVISRVEVQATVQSLETARGELAQAHIQLKDLDVRKLALSKQADKTLETLDTQIAQAENDLELLTLQLNHSAKITSPYSGRIQEVRVVPGQMVYPGTAIVSLEKEDAPLLAVGFIPMVGKKVMPNMVAQISPATVKREEYGYMLGRVMSVSGLPTTRAGMMRLLNNDILVQQLVAKGAPFTIEMDLHKNPQSPSGFLWSSGVGPPVGIESGTLCDVRIVVQEQRPMHFILPALRRIFMGESSQLGQVGGAL